MIPPLSGWPANDDSRPVLIGLTGPIGCGKSTISTFLRDIGGVTIDADELARKATETNSPALSEIRARFGDAVFDADGRLDRARMARIVFADDAALRDLERIVHPRVRALVEDALASATRDRAPFAVIEAIKLVDGGLADRCDEVWIVECDESTQRARLAGRGASPDDIDRRLSTQGSDLATRLRAAVEGRVPVRIVPTEGSLEDVRELVEEYLAEIFWTDQAVLADPQDRPLRKAVHSGNG